MIDEDLDEKLVSWKEVFMYMLLEEHKEYRHSGITEPEEVKISTKQYQNESDHFVQFINENIIASDEYNGQELKLDDIYFVYQEWYKQSKGHNAKIPPRRDLQKNIEKKYGKCSQKRSWTGISFKHIKNQETNDLDNGL